MKGCNNRSCTILLWGRTIAASASTASEPLPPELPPPPSPLLFFFFVEGIGVEVEVLVGDGVNVGMLDEVAVNVLIGMEVKDAVGIPA